MGLLDVVVLSAPTPSKSVQNRSLGLRYVCRVSPSGASRRLARGRDSETVKVPFVSVGVYGQRRTTGR